MCKNMKLGEKSKYNTYYIYWILGNSILPLQDDVGNYYNYYWTGYYRAHKDTV